MHKPENKVEDEDRAEEIKMVSGTMVRTEEPLKVMLKSGGYKGAISTGVFPNENKSLILGIRWISKEKPHIDWTQTIFVAKKRQKLEIATNHQAPLVEKPSPSCQ